MSPEIDEKRVGIVAHRGKAALDVRIVAYYLCAVGLFMLVSSPVLVAGLAASQLHRVLFGIIAIASGLADSVWKLTMGVCLVDDVQAACGHGD